MKILFIADIVGQPGRSIVNHKISVLKKKYEPDFIIANAENAAGGKGLTKLVADEIFQSGVNVITLGNHAFDRKDIESIIHNANILRPLNYPNGVQGRGYGIYSIQPQRKIAVVNLMGRIYMPNTDCPFQSVLEIIEDIRKETKNIFVDFHAEITSEKQTMGYFLDGKVSAVIGTHTHIPTADEKILENGTAYLTDAGMTGPSEGVIGMDREIIIKRYLTGLPQYFTVAKGKSVIQGCAIEIDDETGKGTRIERYSIEID